MKKTIPVFLLLAILLSCAGLAQQEPLQPLKEKPQQQVDVPEKPEQPAEQPKEAPEKPEEQPVEIPEKPEKPVEQQQSDIEVKPVELPWKRTPVIPKPSGEFDKMAEFFKLNLNIKDALRIMAPAQLPYVGIRMEKLDKAITEYGGKEGANGVLLSEVVKESAGEKAGLKKSDVVIAVDGKPLEKKGNNTVKELSTIIGKLLPDQTAKFSILRDKAEMELELTVGRRESVQMPVPGHAEMAFDDVQELSLLEKTLRDNNIFDPFLKTASQIAGTSNMADNKTKVGDKELANPFRLKEVTYCLRTPHNTLLVSQQVSDRLRTRFNRKNQDISGLVRECCSLLDASPSHEERFHSNTFMPSDILNGFTAAATQLDKAFEKIGDDGRNRLAEMILKILGEEDDDDEEKSEEEKKAAHKELEEMLALAVQLNYAKLTDTASCLLDRLTPHNLSCMTANLEKSTTVENHPGVDGDVLLYEETKYGLVVVGGKGANTYREPAALIIDLGGDDIYIDSAAIATTERPFAVVIDYEGDDTYIGRTAGPCSALCGVALLFDFAGNDSYSGKDMCEAWAAAGIAVLADFGGDDIYRAEGYCQGAAVFGIGLLLDTQPGEAAQDKDNKSEGNDTYIANFLSQGLGYTKGIGAIIDTAGNDVYRAGLMQPDFRAAKRSCISLSQGFGYGMRPWDGAPGADGGIGVLADLEGHDFYIGDYFSQGSSYWYALGILFDEKGDDVYLAGRYSQGAGIHLSVGSLIDWAGNDRYSAYFGVSQGLGHDWAVGYLFDAAGNDSYSSNALAQGCGHYVSLGVLADLAGNDTYNAGKRSQGFGNVLENRNAGSLGVLLDCAGNDNYIPAKENGTTTTGSEHGVLIDK